MSKNFSGKFYLFYRIYYTEILSTKMSVRLFGVDSTYRFTDEYLERIVPLLAKRFDLDIYIAPSLKNKRFTGRVIPGENIEDVLNSIGKSYPIRYRISEKNIYIVEK